MVLHPLRIVFGSGFKELVPNFSIRDAGSDQYRLPTSSTCVNLLKVGSLFGFFIWLVDDFCCIATSVRDREDTQAEVASSD
jgi:hypothetical protein